MILIPILLACVGLFCVLSKNNLIGILIGFFFLFTATTMVFVVCGALNGLQQQGYVFGFFILVGGVAQLAVFLALATRLFYQKKSVDVKALRNLRH